MQHQLSTTPSQTFSDRFIPLRSSLVENNDYMRDHSLPKKPSLYSDMMKPSRNSIFSYQKKKTKENTLSQFNTPKSQNKKKRRMERKPVKILDAPCLMDDYYLNLVCWSETNLIGVGLEDSVYFYNFLSNNIVKHFDLPKLYSGDSIPSDEDFCPYICSLSFNTEGKMLATADSKGQVIISDIASNKMISNSAVHSSRIGAVHWQENMLVTGSRDKIMRLFDVRSKLCRPVYSFTGHLQEICGLKFSPNSNYIASGGNDNQLLLWDVRQAQLMSSLGNHEAAVKALTWSPKNHNILVSGAGTSDRKLRVFDVSKQDELLVVDTGSQVCNVIFDKEGDTLLSTHGYSLNQLIIWDADSEYKSLTKEEMLIAHKLRVLYLARSPCGRYVVTGAGDETLRIWKVFNSDSDNENQKSVLNRDLFRLR